MNWLQVIGVGDNGWKSLSPEGREALETAEVVIGSERLFVRLSGLRAECVQWPSPITEVAEVIRTYHGRRVAVVATGDPLWYSVGSLIAKSFASEEVRFHPQLSSFQQAACHMGWALQEVACETIHGRPIELISPLLGDGQRLLLLGENSESPKRVAAFLRQNGFAASGITVLSHLGGVEESRAEGWAENWEQPVPSFHVLAIECRASGPQKTEAGRVPGLSDDHYEHDGQITKREVRAVTLSKLRPMPGELLWDIGCGAGSVAIEWVRAAPGARAIGVDRDAERLGMARRNASRLGAVKLELIEGDAAEILSQSEDPDAVFFGGGMTMEAIEKAHARLRPHGRLVCNAVTLESETLLANCHDRFGGEMCRIAIDTLSPIGSRRGWRPSMPVTQWSLSK
ncbi:MAG: precorrin-6y C5,15-methyltransferase (decarboxylating) subunit CbiE [Rhodospirillales bacterium]|nr:precorrin-6y C5,15-methyltransferase (decarboxylating) subunit CbiE [Rhodospirillales bacterium]